MAVPHVGLDGDASRAAGVVVRGTYTFGEIAARTLKLEVLCSRCPRAGRYHVERLVDRFGAGSNLTPWFQELSADCPNRNVPGWYARCDLYCPILSRVM